MDNANRMRIICNPFKKEIVYQWYDSNIQDYKEVDPETSKLARKEFTNTTIQNMAHKIVEEINGEHNPGNMGLEIFFVGSQEDYDDLCKVINTFYGDVNIECSRDKKYYNSATKVFSEIIYKYAEIKSTLENDPEGEITRQINKYNDVVKPLIVLCIMGLYSSGKSAFINSLIGEEILPSGSDPTTAKVYKVQRGKKYRIRFKFGEKECLLEFEGNKYKPSINCSWDIIKKLEDIIEQEDQHDEVLHMNKALDIINKYDNEEHAISDIIEIWVPFKKIGLPVDGFDFVFCDTPGSNSESNVSHFEVLRASLGEQTNALPVFLTTPDTMDVEDNDKILNLIEETGSLDKTNTIIVINRADEKGVKTLENKRKKCQESKITKWKSTQIFFLSSLLGIASKKNNPDNPDEWLDEEMYENYRKNKSIYVSNEDERKLSEYNIIDESKFTEISEYPDKKETTHLYRNSGLEAVEREIAEYARKYALYNKCQKASEYLQEAIELCVKNIQQAEKGLDIKLKDAQEKFDFGKKELCQKLEKKKENIITYNTEFRELMGRKFEQYVKDNGLVDDNQAKKKLQERLHGEWKKLVEEEKTIKGVKNHSWALYRFEKLIEVLYNGFLDDFTQKTNLEIEKFWEIKSEQFKRGCIDIVHGTDALTAHQKEILKSVLLSTDNIAARRMNINLRQAGGIRKKKFLFWQLKNEKLDVKECCNVMGNQFNNAVRTMLVNLEKGNDDNFKKWADRLMRTLTEQLCEFNSDLRGYSRQIVEYRNNLRQKEECKRMLKESKEYIDGLMEVQGGDGIA